MNTQEIRAGWLSQLQSTLPADRPRAEAGVRQLYSAAGFPEPRFVLWYDSPCAASWPVALLSAEGNRAWRPLLALSAMTKGERERLDRTRAELSAQLGRSTWKEVVQAVGRPRVGTLQGIPDPSLLFSAAMLDARFSIVTDVMELFKVPDENDDLARAEQYLRGGNHGVLASALHCPTTGSVNGSSFFNEYSFSNMADDESRVSGRSVPGILSAAREIARSAHLFWPFENAACLCERPQELHWNARNVPHHEDGAAIVYRDGWRVFAWNGKAVPERWITQPESVPPRDYKGFDPTYGQFAASRSKPEQKAAGRRTAASILSAILPTDHAARIEQIRVHAGGTLPLLDRYRAGAHGPVWDKLISLGASVREDPTAADALAVAYETMYRVRQNVRTLLERLNAIGYRFAEKSPNGAAAAAKQVWAFEKQFGTLPLSLRAFHEIVGEVNLMGSHRGIDPRGNPVAPDPLVVFGLHEGIVEFDEDDDEGASVVAIAPDDLHKANVSGGDAYEMAIPDLRADGELLNERHDLFFVDYLRLAFRYGGFPGYDGRSTIPGEIRQLAADLIEF